MLAGCCNRPRRLLNSVGLQDVSHSHRKGRVSKMPAADLQLERPTRVRYVVLAFACSLSMITYLDRVCISVAAKAIVADLHLNSIADLKWAFTAFVFSYAVFEVPSGWLGDVFGPRKTLIRIVLWWSLFTALTGMVGLSIGSFTVGGLGLLIAIRFLFGMGEAGAYPNITRALHNWFSYRERGFTQGMVWMSGRLMGGLTPLVWTVLIAGIATTRMSPSGDMVEHTLLPPLLHWRSAFYLFGVIGVVWCVFFAIWFRDRPADKASVNKAERELIDFGRQDHHGGHAGVPWGRLLVNRNLWTLCMMYFCAAYGWYFNITYLPQFLEGQHGVSETSLLGAMYKGGPLWLGAAGCLLGGFVSDWYVRRTGNLRMGRRLLGIFGHLLCAVCYFICPFMTTAFTFFMAISLAAFFNDLTMGPAWATCQDIGKRYAAIVAGCMNTIGNLGGTVAAYATGKILDITLNRHATTLGMAVDKLSDTEKAAGLAPGYQINFFIFGAVYVIAVLLWLQIDATKSVVEESKG
jgi:ACS family glucarate transporter-like MFS transporter